MVKMSSSPVNERIRGLKSFSAGPSCNSKWQSSGSNSNLESEWPNFYSNSETVVSNSEYNFDRYIDINEDNSALLYFFHPSSVFFFSSNGISMRKYQGVTPEFFLQDLLHSYVTPQEGNESLSDFCRKYAQSAVEVFLLHDLELLFQILLSSSFNLNSISVNLKNSCSHLPYIINKNSFIYLFFVLMVDDKKIVHMHTHTQTISLNQSLSMRTPYNMLTKMPL